MEGSVKQAEQLARMAADYDNLRAALEWARDTGEDEVLLRLAAAAGPYWRSRSLTHREARPWLTLALERASSPPAARMKVLNIVCGVVIRFDRDYARAELLIAEWRRIAEWTGDETQVLVAPNAAAEGAQERCDFDEARTRFVEVRETAERIGDRSFVAVALLNLAENGVLSGDFQAGLDFGTEALELCRELGDDIRVLVALFLCGQRPRALRSRAGGKVLPRGARRSPVGWERSA